MSLAYTQDMTKLGTVITVEADELKDSLALLLSAVEREGESVQICRGGKPIAVMRPAAPPPDPLAPHPELKPLYIAEDAFAPLTPEDWPEECR